MKISKIAMQWRQFKTDMWFYNLFCSIEEAIRKNSDKISTVANRSYRNGQQFPSIERRLLAIEAKLGIEPRPSSENFTMPTDKGEDESAKLLED